MKALKHAYRLSTRNLHDLNELRGKLQARERRYRRLHRTEVFAESLELLREFCERGDADEWKRYLVCGICWSGEFVGVNNQQLMAVLDRSKSTINDVFLKLGYKNITVNSGNESTLTEKIPYLGDRPEELRQWTIRVNQIEKSTKTPTTKADTEDPLSIFDDLEALLDFE